MASLQINILNPTQIANGTVSTNDLGTTITSGIAFLLVADGSTVASAFTDASGNLDFTIPDGTDTSTLSLVIDVDSYEQFGNLIPTAIPKFIPTAPATSPTVDWTTQPANLPATPFGQNWTPTETPTANGVNYAVSFFSMTGESPLGPFSENYFDITDKACPVMENIPTYQGTIPDTQMVGRNIYRKFYVGGVENPEIVMVGRIPNNTDTTFQDMTP